MEDRPRESGVPLRASTEWRSPADDAQEQQEQIDLLRGLFSKGPWYGLIGFREAPIISRTGIGPAGRFRQIGLTYRTPSAPRCIEVITVVADRAPAVVAEKRGMSQQMEVEAIEGGEQAWLSVDKQPVSFAVWSGSESVVAMARLDDRAIVISADGPTALDELQLERIASMDGLQPQL